MISEIPFVGADAGIRLLNCFKKLHNIPREIVVAGLQQQLDTFYRRGWYACLFYADGRGVMRSDDRRGRGPNRAQAEKMIELCVLLNREAHFDGHWVGVWSDDRLSVIWRDWDGDLHFTIDFDEPWARLRDWPAAVFAARATAAHAEWLERMYVVDAKSAPQIRAAQGEPSAAADQ